jgi:predicted Fe-Mo cluster-binding NifX family protein
MARKFVFIKDVEDLLKQGKTEMQLPEGTRFSPAALDLIRENKIQVSYTGRSLPSGEGLDAPANQKQPPNEPPVSSEPALVAIASDDREPSGPTGRLAGRGAYFLIFDHKGRFIDIVKNPYSAANQGIAPRVADLLAASEVSLFVAERFGQKIKDALSDKNIQYLEFSGPVEEAVKFVFNQKGGDKSVPIN